MESNLNRTLKPLKIRFTQNGIQIIGPGLESCKIPYRNLVSAGIRIFGEGPGGYYEPEVTEITEDMRGELVLCDRENRRYRIRTELTGRPAGSILRELGMRAPYILIGRQAWLAMDDAEAFREAGSMVEIMRECR